jgi:site-specific DNA-methyltransferase (adenine-specific)
MTSPTSAIIRGDVHQTLWTLPTDFADLICADPGYGLGTKGDWDLEPQYDGAWIREALRVLKPDGSLYIFGRPEIIAAHWPAFPGPKRLLTWAVSNRVSPRCRTWQPTTESIVLITKGQNPYFDRDAVREPYGPDFERHRGRRRPATPGRFGNQASTYSDAAGALPRDVIRGPGLSGKVGARESLGHPCQKPLWLLERLIKASCPPGGLVLDLYAGTSTASLAAHKLGRGWIAVESDARWCEVSATRLRAAGAEDATIVVPPSPSDLWDLAAWKAQAQQELVQLREAVAKLTSKANGSI